MLSPITALLFGFACASFLPEDGPRLAKKQIPAEPTGVKTITSPNGATIRYKEPGKEGICETTPGVNSYSGYVDLDDETHMFFYFFEARHNPNEAPITLWLNGGPGSDSLIGLFEELGPCNVTRNLTVDLNPYAWNEVSNMLFLSQPIGTGFSYADEVVGYINETTGLAEESDNPTGRWPDIDPYKIDNTDLAAIGTWEVLQAFLQELPQLDATVQSREFNLWTESYGGHYGPAFYHYFYEQNLAIQAGEIEGTELNMQSLGIINGIISARIQMPYYPEFAYRNTYGLETINETVYNYMKMNYEFPGACRDQIDSCASLDHTTQFGKTICSEANAVCSLVMVPFFFVSDRNVYDIRAKGDAQIPPRYWTDFLNLPATQNALGVNLNYTASSFAVNLGFDSTGDFIYTNLLEDLEAILDSGVRVALIYGDADYICNWFGGEAVSLEVNYTHAEEFRSSGYAPFVVDGTEYGVSRQYGNFSFTRVYDSGHEIPYYQPKASLELFRRVLDDLVIADGKDTVTETYKSNGTANATHTESFSGYYTGQPGINDKRKG